MSSSHFVKKSAEKGWFETSRECLMLCLNHFANVAALFDTQFT